MNAQRRPSAPADTHLDRRSPVSSPVSSGTNAGTGTRARPRIRTRLALLTVVVAPVAALAGWTVLAPLGGIDLLVRTGPQGPLQEVTPGSVAVAGLGSGLAGWFLLSLLVRFTRRPRRWWTVAAAAVLVGSLTGPTSAAGTPARLALMALHLVVGGVVLAGLRAAAPASQPFSSP